jgi:RNA polymerase sigma-70 factor (ECF subfamily)
MIPEPSRDALARAAGGDADAFGEIVETLMRYTYNLACRISGDRVGAEDLCQEVFLRLHRQLDRYDAARPFGPWFRTLAVRTILNGLRRSVPFPSDLPEDAVVTEFAPPREPSERLRRAVRLLPEEYRAAVTMRYLEDLPLRQIGEALGVPVGTVKTWLFRAREMIRATLEPHLEELP